jgi:hypothetical protein
MRLPLSTEFLTHTLHNSQKLQNFSFGGVCVLLALFSKLQTELRMSSLRGSSFSKVERRKKFMCFPRSLVLLSTTASLWPITSLGFYLQKVPPAVPDLLLAFFSQRYM